MIGLIGLNIQESRSSLGTAPAPFKAVETMNEHIVMIPIPGVIQGGLDVYVKNMRKLVVVHETATTFTPKFRFEFNIPDDTNPLDYRAVVEHGVLFLHLIKKSS
jgi:HSP20 family molecular chaperone IbpA